jgi:hypothetical protein
MGRPEDFISKCTNINYIKVTDKHSTTVEEIKDFMKKLFPVVELHKCLIRNSCLDILVPFLISIVLYSIQKIFLINFYDICNI